MAILLFRREGFLFNLAEACYFYRTSTHFGRQEG
jgi:hypothetical protein